MARVTTTTIPGRFAGPPFAANGGYTAGLLAERMGTRSAHVSLRAPVPLDVPIEIRRDGQTASIVHNGRALVTASPASLVDNGHPMVDFVTAAVAAGGTDPEIHPFPHCFVCGPDRGADDGMHLFAGRVTDDIVAVPWQPTMWQADPTGTVPVRMMTAALDCPSVFPRLEAGGAALLASMSFQIGRLPRVGEDLVAIGWARHEEGRKLFSASAIATADGETLGRAETLWIAVQPEDLHQLASSMTRRVA